MGKIPSSRGVLSVFKRCVRVGWTPVRYRGRLLPRLIRRLSRLDRLEREYSAELEREKLEALKELAYGASHEINNPLANISTRAQTLMREETDPERRRKLAVINAQAFRAHEMISDMMLFARPPMLERERGRSDGDGRPGDRRVARGGRIAGHDAGPSHGGCRRGCLSRCESFGGGIEGVMHQFLGSAGTAGTSEVFVQPPLRSPEGRLPVRGSRSWSATTARGSRRKSAAICSIPISPAARPAAAWDLGCPSAGRSSTSMGAGSES
jgi:hypothetical protein